MDDFSQIKLHKKLLLQEVSSFCRKDATRGLSSGRYLSDEFERITNSEEFQNGNSIHPVIDEIRDRNWKAVFFGGMLRSLLVSKLNPEVARPPRDIDIVISGARINEIEEVFEESICRKTRFGGLKLRRTKWQFDVWPLDETQALLEDDFQTPTFADLPMTTFLNVEAIAVEVWPAKGHARRIYSGDDQFFRSIIDRTIEINRAQNLYPELCVVRSLVMAANLKWKVGPRLLSYLGLHGSDMSNMDFEEIQIKHYGGVQLPGAVFTEAMNCVEAALQSGKTVAVDLPLPSQLTLWPEDDVYYNRIFVRAAQLASKKRRRMP